MGRGRLGSQQGMARTMAARQVTAAAVSASPADIIRESLRSSGTMDLAAFSKLGDDGMAAILAEIDKCSSDNVYLIAKLKTFEELDKKLKGKGWQFLCLNRYKNISGILLSQKTIILCRTGIYFILVNGIYRQGYCFCYSCIILR